MNLQKTRLFDALTLSLVRGLGPRRVAELLRAGVERDLIDAPERFQALPDVARDELRAGFAQREAERQLKETERLGFRAMALGDSDYPEKLSAIYDPPSVLWVRGRWTSTSLARRAAIVGSRDATPDGSTFTLDLATALSRSGVEVVSGLARGIDASAHRGAVAGGTPTLAVLGSGLDVMYPKEHAPLADRIVEGGGAILSELPLGTGPAAENFPKRNRIIVGLSDVIVVVEAAARSGALITARVGLEEGREVMAVPGRPWDRLAEGPNALIGDGARMVRNAADALNALGVAAKTAETAPSTVSAPSDPVLRTLSGKLTKSLDDIVEATALAASEVLRRITTLEQAGLIERLPGALFRSVRS